MALARGRRVSRRVSKVDYPWRVRNGGARQKTRLPALAKALHAPTRIPGPNLFVQPCEDLIDRGIVVRHANR
jgi:hypothetical protein